MKYEYAYLNNKIRDGMMSNAMRMVFYLITLMFLKHLVKFYLISLIASHVYLPRLWEGIGKDRALSICVKGQALNIFYFNSIYLIR